MPSQTMRLTTEQDLVKSHELSSLQGKRQTRFLINALACFRCFHPKAMILQSQIMLIVEGKSLQILTLLDDLVIPI